MIAKYITVKELWPIEIKCVLCEKICSLNLWLPMYEGKVVSTSFMDWAGMPVCKKCFDIHNVQK